MLPRQEMLPRQVLPRETSSIFVVLPFYAAFGRVGLVFSCLSRLFQLVSASDRESGPGRREEAVAISCLFQLSAARGREPGPATEGRGESCGGPLWLFPFRPMLSRVRPARLCVEQVVVQRPNLAFGRSKSSQQR